MDAHERLRESTHYVSPGRSLVSLAVWRHSRLICRGSLRTYVYILLPISVVRRDHLFSSYVWKNHHYRCISTTADRVTFHVRRNVGNLVSIALSAKDHFFSYIRWRRTTFRVGQCVCVCACVCVYDALVHISMRIEPDFAHTCIIYMCTMVLRYLRWRSMFLNPRTGDFLKSLKFLRRRSTETRATTVERYSCMRACVRVCVLCVSVDFFPFFLYIYIYIYV